MKYNILYSGGRIYAITAIGKGSLIKGEKMMKRSNNAAEHKGLLFTGISALLFLSTFLTVISRAQTIVYADLVLTHADRNENRETININSKGRISENEAKD